jgi:hypothetical protein
MASPFRRDVGRVLLHFQHPRLLSTVAVSCCTLSGQVYDCPDPGAWGIVMFALVVEFSPASDAASQFVQVIEQTALRMVKAQAGCIAAFVDLRGQVVMGVSIWGSKSDAERFSRECYPDIENTLRPFLKCDPELHTFEAREIESVTLRVRAMMRRTSDSQGLGFALP